MSKPFVVIELDKPRKLRYGMNQLALLEEVLQVPLTELGNIRFGVKELRLFLWAGLTWEDPKLTVEQVGELADNADMNYLVEKVGEALAASLGVEQEKKGNVKKPVVGGTGQKP